MNYGVQPDFSIRNASLPLQTRTTKSSGMSASRFFDLAMQLQSTTARSNPDVYLNHLKQKYGNVTLENIGTDPASLQKAGGRMSGHDVIIAPNIFADMANDPKKAARYEQKIDAFFQATPRLKAHFAVQGLTYEPCGVVIHEDGSVTYICGGGDSPERVAEVNRINREKNAQKAARQRQYQMQAAASAAERRFLWEHIVQTEPLKRYIFHFSSIDEVLQTEISQIPQIPLDC